MSVCQFDKADSSCVQSTLLTIPCNFFFSLHKTKFIKRTALTCTKNVMCNKSCRRNIYLVLLCMLFIYAQQNSDIFSASLTSLKVGSPSSSLPNIGSFNRRFIRSQNMSLNSALISKRYFCFCVFFLFLVFVLFYVI